MSDCRSRLLVVLSLASVCFALPRAQAVPYASQVIQTGNTVEFVLNMPADSITILRDGANEVNIPTPMKGRHTFDMTGFSDFEIQVANDAESSWTDISLGEEADLHTFFFRPTGVAVNKDPSSPYFGTIYVSHPVERIPDGFVVTDPRATGVGIYSLSADRITVDLASNFAEVTDPDDETLANTVTGWELDQNNFSSPYKLSLDESNNLIVGDFSDQHGGIKYAAPDLQTGGLVLAAQDGVIPLLDIGPNGEEVHGSIVSAVGVRGSVGTDLVVWGVDEDYDLDGDTFTDPDPDDETIEPQESVYHVWRWDVDAATDYSQPPTLAVDKELLSGPNDNGTPADTTDDYNDLAFTLTNSEAGGFIFNNMYYDDRFGKAYITQDRFHGNESGLFIVTPNGDGGTQTLEWSSKGFSAANGLDGAVGAVPDGEGNDPSEGLQDIFRAVADVAISPDGETMYVYRSLQYGEGNEDGNNPVLGPTSNAAGLVLVVPLDENGLPDLVVDNNGTPGDTSDDFVSNISSIPIEDNGGRTHRIQITTDAAGNVHIVDNLSERLQVWSPGGNTLAVTGSDGTFSVTDPSTSFLAGDFNGDGFVDGADLSLLLGNWGSNVPPTPSGWDGAAPTEPLIDASELSALLGTWGQGTPPSAAGAGQVPEPSSVLLVVAMCGISLLWRQSR